MKSGDHVVFMRIDGELKAFVYPEDRELDNLPSDLSVDDGSARRYVEAEAAKLGLTVSPAPNTPYVLYIK